MRDYRLLPIVGAIPFQPSQTVGLDLIKRSVYSGLILRFSGNLDSTVQGARQPEPVQSLLRRVALLDGDSEVVAHDGRGLLQLNRFLLGYSPGLLVVPPDPVTVAVHPFALDLLFPFGHLKSGNEVATWIDLARVSNPTLSVTWGTAADVTAGTATIQAGAGLRVLGMEIKGTESSILGRGGAFSRFVVYPKRVSIGGAVSNHQVRLQTSAKVRGLLIQALTAAGVPSDTMITGLRVKERTEDTVQELTWGDAQAVNRLVHLQGGNPDTGWVFLDFLRTGREQLRDVRGLDAFDLFVDASAACSLNVYHVMEATRGPRV